MSLITIVEHSTIKNRLAHWSFCILDPIGRKKSLPIFYEMLKGRMRKGLNI